LVRLFIGRNENGLRDIYDEYKENYRMEEGFRRDLKKYSEQTQPRIRPAQVPPLVPAFARIRPTATNRMYNAVIVSQNFGGEWSESTTAPIPPEAKAVLSNQQGMRDLLEAASVSRERLACEIIEEDGSASRASFDVLISEPGPSEVISFLKSYRWLRDEVPASIIRQIEYLEGKAGQTGITGWRVLAFQSAKSVGTAFSAAEHDFNCRKRSRTKTLRFNVYSEPDHRAIAHYLAGVEHDRSIRKPNSAMQALRDTGKAIMVFYPVRQEATESLTIGFALLFPKNALPFQLTFSVRDPRQPNAVTVPAGSPLIAGG
jgi:hypothetical protein